MIDHLELTDGQLLGITTDKSSSTYSITRELQKTLEASRIKWLALRHHICCLMHIIRLRLGTVLRSVGNGSKLAVPFLVKVGTKLEA